jgi:hypothetical protein
MNATSTPTKLLGLFFSLLMTVSILGATVFGMLSGAPQNSHIVTLERVVVSAEAPTAVN